MTREAVSVPSPNKCRGQKILKGGLIMKKYDIYFAGGEKITTIYSSCISKACKLFIETLEKPAKYKLDSKYIGSIRYSDNFLICDNFVVIEA